jgi:hypothetical protein
MAPIARVTTVIRQLVLIDLPVDLVVVLEQQERASQTQRSEKALVESRCR